MPDGNGLLRAGRAVYRALGRPMLLRAPARAIYAALAAHADALRQPPATVENGEIAWYHSMTLGETETHGPKSSEILAFEADIVFKHPVRGKSVLDIGAWDGFFSFEAERRGAADVLSTDWFCWGGPGWGTRAGYDHAHRALGSRCRAIEVDVPDLDPDVHGRFDVVLFLGVLYHLKEPLTGLQRAAAMTRDLLVVETATAMNKTEAPLMRFLPGDVLAGDDTNFWLPNIAAVKAMLETEGFTRFEVTENPQPDGKLKGNMRAERHIIHAWR